MPGAVRRIDLDTLPSQSQGTLEVEPLPRRNAAYEEHDRRPRGVDRSEALGLPLELDVVFGQAAPVICLPREDPGRGTYARVAAARERLLGKRRRALEVAAMFRGSPGGVEPAGARIVVVAPFVPAILLIASSSV